MVQEFHRLSDYNQKQRNKVSARSQLRSALDKVSEDIAMDMAEGNDSEEDLPEIEVGDFRFTVRLEVKRKS